MVSRDCLLDWIFGPNTAQIRLVLFGEYLSYQYQTISWYKILILLAQDPQQDFVSLFMGNRALLPKSWPKIFMLSRDCDAAMAKAPPAVTHTQKFFLGMRGLACLVLICHQQKQTFGDWRTSS